MREHPDHYDAELLLRLYDLRREAKLRAARDWFMREFQASSNEELEKRFLDRPEESAFFRMVISYWEMAASFITSGVLNRELFFQSGGEMLFVWERIRHLVPQARDKYRNPAMYSNLETVANAFIQWMNKRAPEAYAAFSSRVRGS